MRGFGRQIRRAFIVAAAGIVFAVREAANFRRQMAFVNTMLGPQSNIAAFTEDVRRLSAELGVTKDELSLGLFQVLSAQVPPNNAISFLINAAKTAVGGAAAIETSVKAIVRVIESWNLTTADATMVSDKLFRIVEKGIITYEQLADKIGVVSGLAAKAGVSIDELAGVIATASKTVEADKIFTGLRSAITALLKPGPLLRAEFEKLGTSGSELIRQKGFLGALEELNRLAEGSVDKFAELVGNVRALPVILAVTGSNAKKAQENVEAMADSAGASARAFEKMNIVRQWPRLWQSILGIVSKVGEVIDKTLQPVVEAISQRLLALAESKAFQSFLNNMRNVVQQVLNLVAALTTGFGRKFIIAGLKEITLGIKDLIIAAFAKAAQKAIDMLVGAGVFIGRAIAEGFRIAQARRERLTAAREQLEREGKIPVRTRVITIGGKIFGGPEEEKEMIRQRAGEQAEKETLAAAKKFQEAVSRNAIEFKDGSERIAAGFDLIDIALEQGERSLNKWIKETDEAAKKTALVTGKGVPLSAKTEIIEGLGGAPGVAAGGRQFSELRRIGANIISGAGAGPNVQKEQLSVLQKSLQELQTIGDELRKGKITGGVFT